MFLRHTRTARFAAAYVLLFTAALILMVPKVNVPETLFDEATIPTNEMVTQKDNPSAQFLRSDIAVPQMFAESRRISVPRILTVYAGRLIARRAYQELFCTLLC